jgi:hypothetical protein
MEDQYQPQPYQYEGQPVQESPTGSWFLRNKKWVLIGAGALVGLIILTLIILFFVNRSRANQAALVALENQRAEAVQSMNSACEDATDPAGCLAAIPGELAQDFADPAYCVDLTGAALDSCLTLAALSAHDPDICEGVGVEEKRLACSDAAVSAIPASERTYDTCDLYSTEERQQRCREGYVTAMLVSGTCASEVMTAEQCAVSEVVARAKAAKDPDVCNELGDSYAGFCKDLVGVADRDLDGLTESEERTYGTDDRSIDSDSDGLSDADEVNIYSTDPANQDSDGDGFPDGTEVNSGYNPNGPGML